MFITFEGIEGAGKGTIIDFTRAWFTERHMPCLCTREPGGSKLGRQLRSLLLHKDTYVVPDAEMFLYLADRAQHVTEVIRPALAAGTVVICDRFADSNIVYQGYGRGLDVDELFALNERAVRGLWPDMTFLLDLPVDVGLLRARNRNTEQGISESEGRFEAENVNFHTHVRQGFLDWAKRHADRFHIIDASLRPEDVWRQVRSILEKAFP